MEKVRADQLALVLETISMQGSPDSPFWFMGLEEGTNPEISADEQILNQLHVAEHQLNNGPIGLDYARERRTLQPTWCGYIKLLLSMRDGIAGSGFQWTESDVLEYQREQLGALVQHEYGSSLLELFPLPRKSRGHRWIYSDVAHRPGMEFLSSVKDFNQHPLVKNRASSILNKVAKHEPRVLFVFGNDGKYALKHRIDNVMSFQVVKDDQQNTHPAHIGTFNSTLIVFSRHPTSYVTDRHWRELGLIVADHLPPLLDKAA